MNYIMILEDDEELAFGMEMALKDKDFSFTVCSTVKDAAAALKSQTFDLLLLDVNLPDGSGFAFCQDIRRESYDSFIRIHVRDQGPGISEKEQGMIFQRFYRSPSVSQEKGLGIGLYLAREILAKEGGYIKVDSSPGKGSDFSVFLSRHALSNSVYF